MKGMDRGWFILRREHISGPLHGNGVCIALWAWLNSVASFQDTTVRFQGKPRILRRGSLISSVREISEELGFSRHEITRQLKFLEEWGQVILDAETTGTLITIVNYTRDQSFNAITPNDEIKQNGNQPETEQKPSGNDAETERKPTDPERKPCGSETETGELESLKENQTDPLLPNFLNGNDAETKRNPDNTVTTVTASTTEPHLYSSPLPAGESLNGTNGAHHPKLPELAALWNQFADSNLPRVRSMDSKSKRYKSCRARWTEAPDQKYWISVIKKLNESRFLTGKNKNSTWKADISFFTRPEKHVEILEGKYDNRNGPNGNGTGANGHQQTTENFDFTKPNGGTDESPLVSPSRLERMRRRVEDDKNPTK